MSIQKLTEAANVLEALLRAARRDYALDDTMVFCVRPCRTIWRKRVPGGVEESAKIELETNVALREDEFSSVSLESDHVTVLALSRVLEIKGTLEKWKRGELDELPPSTFSFTDDDAEYVVEGRGRRRRRIRVDE
jgi:hypothetical protein